MYSVTTCYYCVMSNGSYGFYFSQNVISISVSNNHTQRSISYKLQHLISVTGSQTAIRTIAFTAALTLVPSSLLFSTDHHIFIHRYTISYSFSFEWTMLIPLLYKFPPEMYPFCLGSKIYHCSFSVYSRNFNS